MKVHITRTYSFAASHRLHSPALTDAENRLTYGKCDNPHGHGHNYEVVLTVAGEVDPVTGRAADLDALDALARREVITPFHHRNLNEEVPAFRTAVPTTENLTLEVDRRLRAAWPDTIGARLETVRIRETDRNICELSDGND